MGVQKARLLALATGQHEATHPAPATPAASPLPAPEDGRSWQRSADSGRCHSHCQFYLLVNDREVYPAVDSSCCYASVNQPCDAVRPAMRRAGLALAEQRTAMTGTLCAAPAAPCQGTQGGRRPRWRPRRGRTCGGRPRRPLAAGESSLPVPTSFGPGPLARPATLTQGDRAKSGVCDGPNQKTMPCLHRTHR